MQAPLDPLGILRKSEQSSSTETARVDNIHVGACPICKAGMKITKIKVGGSTVDAYICASDRVCMPVQNSPVLEGLYET